MPYILITLYLLLWACAVIFIAEAGNEVRMTSRNPRQLGLAAAIARAQDRRDRYWNATDADGHCSRCGLPWSDEELSADLRHECPPGFWKPCRFPQFHGAGVSSGAPCPDCEPESSPAGW